MFKPIKIQFDDFSFLMLPIEGGAFDMGDEEDDLWLAGQPIHQVQVPFFYLAQHLVTQHFWEKIMGENWPHRYFAGKKDQWKAYLGMMRRILSKS